MLPETPLEIAIYEKTYQNDQQKSNVQERCRQQHRQKKRYQNITEFKCALKKHCTELNATQDTVIYRYR